ncbi:MAG: hypothetical protein NTV21_06120 [Planctomycetota bacterium]|nr:hypothetical protein [Planctomycetota bacterium]
MLAALILSFVSVFPSQESVNRTDPALKLNLYEIRDLAERVGPDFPSRKIGAARPVGPKGSVEHAVPVLSDIPVLSSMFTKPETGAEGSDPAARLAAGARVIESAISRLILPKVKDSQHFVRCTNAQTLLVNGSPAQLEWVDSFLQHLRGYDKLVEVHAHFVRVPNERLKELGIEGTSVFPKPEDVPTLLEALKATPKVEFLSAPRVMALPLQRASISVLDQVRYIGDWRVETVEPGAQEVLVPSIEELETGLALDVRAVPLPGEKFALTLEAQDARLARPLVSLTQKLKTKQGEVPVTLALPEVDIQRVQTELLLQDGSTAVLVVDPSSSKDRLVILVTVRSVAAK